MPYLDGSLGGAEGLGRPAAITRESQVYFHGVVESVACHFEKPGSTILEVSFEHLFAAILKGRT